MRPKIFITGGTGLLGINWALESLEEYIVAINQHKRKLTLPNIDSFTVDLENKTSIAACFEQWQPALIIHTAAMTNVEACEKDPQSARFINAELAANVAEIAYAQGIKLIHISTDQLFDGTQAFLSEEANPCPLNAYAVSKAYGEESVLKHNPDALILRCNFYGWGTNYRHSFSDFIYHALKAGKPVKLFNDVFYTPATTHQLIKCAHALVEKNAKGIFNMVGAEKLSKYDFGLQLARAFDLDERLIRSCSIDEANLLAKRPKDMSLSDKKVSALLKEGLGSVAENLAILAQQLDNHFSAP